MSQIHLQKRRNKVKLIKIFMMVILILPFVFFAGCTEDSAKGNEVSEHKEKDLYYCPMHPQVTSDRPGSCPICHMDLVKKADNSPTDAKEMEGMLTLTERGQVLANVSTVKVKKENAVKQITAFGYLEFEEPTRKYITARFNGRIEKLFVDATGEYIRKGQPLFEIYSPDLVQAQNDYLIALRQTKPAAYASTSDAMNIKDENLFLNSSRKKLELFGITRDQIKEIEADGVKLTLTYYSPYSGTVIEKKVREGMYVGEGSIIYDIAELSTLWNIAEVYADDVSMIKSGDKVNLTTQSFPGETFTGKVTFIYPVVNSESRTIKIRSVVPNPQNKLKPQMYTETVFIKNYGESVTVPGDAVLFTGKRTLVWVKTSESGDSANGMFEPRDVNVGIKFDGKYQITSGLSEGEEVAVQGGFLIDSESQLKTGMPTGHQHGGTQQGKSTGRKENMNTNQNKTNEHSNH